MTGTYASGEKNGRVKVALPFFVSLNPTLGVGFGEAYSYADDRKLLLL